jgi:DNA-binding GntR family transcriptional regulator
MLVELVKAGEAEKAAELCSRHLKKAEEHVLSGAEMSTVVDLFERRHLNG